MTFRAIQPHLYFDMWYMSSQMSKKKRKTVPESFLRLTPPPSILTDGRTYRLTTDDSAVEKLRCLSAGGVTNGTLHHLTHSILCRQSIISQHNIDGSHIIISMFRYNHFNIYNLTCLNEIAIYNNDVMHPTKYKLMDADIADACNRQCVSHWKGFICQYTWENNYYYWCNAIR